MRKVAHLLESPIEHHGGLNVLVRELASGLSPFYEIFVFCPRQSRDRIAPNESPISFSYMPWEAGASDDEVFHHIKSAIVASQIELLIFHGGDFNWGPVDGRISMIDRLSPLRLPCIYVNHQSTPLFANTPTLHRPNRQVSIRSFSRFVISWVLKAWQLYQTTVEITVSTFEEAQARRRYFFFRRKFIQIYHSRVPSCPQGLREEVKKEKVILNVGHFAFRKGQHILLKAFGRIASKHPLWKLQLVGASAKDEYWNSLQRLIEDFGLHSQIELVPEALHPESHFAKASIYVQPSLIEAYGLAIQEAMSFGCACVGSTSGGIPESVPDPNLLYPPGDDLSLSRILDRLMSDELLTKEYQESARNDFAKFNRNRDQMITDYRHIIEKCFRAPL